MRKNFGAKTWLYPMPVLIIGTYDGNGTPNAMNAAWGGIYDTNMVMVCLADDHKTTENIKNTGAFTVSFATSNTVVPCDYVGMIEDEGYDACLQKSVPNLRVKGDKTTNPEVMDTYELIHAVPVAEGKPAPDVIIDFGKAAKACGIGERGLSGKILNAKYGPYMRYCFIITDEPLDFDEPVTAPICDGCGECIKACPGKAIDEKGLDTWQCSVYYKGAHRSNPFMSEDFLKGDPNREAILGGDFRFDAVSARELYLKMKFLPDTQWGYSACLCGRACDYACYNHLTGGKKK